MADPTQFVPTPYMPPSAAPYFRMMTPGMAGPALTNSVAPAAFGSAAVPQAPVALPVGPSLLAAQPGNADARYAAAQNAANAAIANGVSNFLTPAPLSPAAVAQAASDRAAITGAVGGAASGVGDTLGRIGSAALDVATLLPRGVMGAANTLLRVPNAFGAQIPYIPENAFGGSSSSLTPYYDKYVRAGEPAGAPGGGGLVSSANAATPNPTQSSAANAGANPGQITPIAPGITPERGRAFVAGLDNAPQRDVGESPTIGADGQWNRPPLPENMRDGSVGLPAGMPEGELGGGGAGGDDSGLPPLWRPAQTIGAPTRFGQPATGSSGNAFLDNAMGYIQSGSNMFEQASRARQMAALIGGYSEMQSATTNAGANIFGSQARLRGEEENIGAENWRFGGGSVPGGTSTTMTDFGPMVTQDVLQRQYDPATGRFSFSKIGAAADRQQANTVPPGTPVKQPDGVYRLKNGQTVTVKNGKTVE